MALNHSAYNHRVYIPIVSLLDLNAPYCRIMSPNTRQGFSGEGVYCTRLGAVRLLSKGCEQDSIHWFHHKILLDIATKYYKFSFAGTIKPCHWWWTIRLYMTVAGSYRALNHKPPTGVATVRHPYLVSPAALSFKTGT